jgi:prevent-host-death family protein
MPWNIAQAKQRFSEVVKQASEEPQLIYNRNQPVAAVIGAEEFAKFQEWRKTQTMPRTLADDFAELRALAAGDPDPLPDPDRRGPGRPNAFLEMLEEEESLTNVSD